MRRLPEALLGLAPAASGSCPRCGEATTGLANGRARLDLCARCGTLHLATPEGLDLLRMRAESALPALDGFGVRKESALDGAAAMAPPDGLPRPRIGLGGLPRVFGGRP